MNIPSKTDGILSHRIPDPLHRSPEAWYSADHWGDAFLRIALQVISVFSIPVFNTPVFNIVLSIMLSALVLGVSFPVYAETGRFDLVVIDAGHGGHDEGALGRSGLREKDLVLDVSRRLAKRLRKRGIKVVLTRDRDDFLSLEERTAVANDARADLFVSIHANASRSAKPKGIETYFASLDATDADARETAERENRALGKKAPEAREADPLAAILGDLIETQHLQESSEFAMLAQEKLAAVDRSRSRGVKQAPFVVLMGVRMPASLVEIGFLTNPADEAGLRRGRRRDAIADALSTAVSDFGERYDARRGVGKEKTAAGRSAAR